MDHLLGPHWPQRFPIDRPFKGKKQVFLSLHPMAKGRAYRLVRASTQNFGVTLLWSQRPTMQQRCSSESTFSCESVPFPCPSRCSSHNLSASAYCISFTSGPSWWTGRYRTWILPFHMGGRRPHLPPTACHRSCKWIQVSWCWGGLHTACQWSGGGSPRSLPCQRHAAGWAQSLAGRTW